MKRLTIICTVLLFLPFILIGFLLHCAGAGLRCGKEIAEEFIE